MGTKMVRQTTFTTGEVDVVNWKRTDIELYMTAAQSLLNMEVATTGLAKKRKGSKFLIDVTAYATTHSHMYEFIDKFGNYYIIMSADSNFYVFADNEGVPFDVVDHLGNFIVTSRGNQVVAGDQGVSLIQTISTPYTNNDLDGIDYALDNDVLILTHPDFPPARIYIDPAGYLTDPFTFSYQVLNIYPFPAYDFGNINYNNFTVAISGDTSTVTFQFTGVGADPGFDAAWIGGIIIGGGATETSPLGYGTITAVSYGAGGGGITTFTLRVQIPFNLTNPSTVGSQYSVRQPAWSDALGWPAKVLFYQNRLWLANSASLPSTVFGSQINAPLDFDVGVGLDTDAIAYTIGQTNSGAILWMNGGKQMEVYCQNSEFAAPQEQNIGLTPSSFSIRQQSSYGSSPILKPVTYINDSYYVTKTGQAIINFHYNGIGQTYTSSNISVASNHLVNNPQRAALLRGTDISQDNFIYFLNTNNELVTSFQFAAEYKLAALTPMNFNTNPFNHIQVRDIVTVNNEIYFLKFYSNTDNERVTIEIMDETRRVDSYIGTGMGAASPSGLSLVTGLDVLEGYIGEIIFENQDYGETLDSSGNVAAITGGQAYVFNPNSSIGHITVGLLYAVALSPMYVFAGSTGADYYKQITRIFVDYYNSLDFEINGTLVPFQNFAEIQHGLPLTPKTDTAVISPVIGWDRFSTFTITQNSPFDLQITSIAYQIDAKII